MLFSRQFHKVSRILFHYIKNPSSHLLDGMNLTSWSSANLFYQYALKNKMFPFISHLTSCRKCQKKINPKFVNKIKSTFKTLLLISLIREKEKQKLGKLLAKKGTPVVFLKNFNQIKNFYPNNFCYQIDTDLFTNSKHQKQLDRLLVNRGYRKVQKKEEKSFEYGKKEVHYFKTLKSGIPFIVEVHYDILVSLKFHPHPEAIVEFSNQALKRAKKQASGFLELSPEDELLYLILHFYLNDFLQGLRNLYDIARFIEFKRGPLSLNKLYQTAKQYHSYLIVIFVLGLVKNFFLPQLKIDKSFNRFSLKLAYFFYNPLLTTSVFTDKPYLFKEHRYQLKNFQVINSLVNRRVDVKTLWRIFRYALPILVSRSAQNNPD